MLRIIQTATLLCMRQKMPPDFTKATRSAACRNSSVWNPHKAEKDVEVGDFYFKRKNYRAALDRYREALYYKYDDAVAMFRLAVCQEKIGEGEEARKAYEAYLRILPHGPFANEAHQGLERLKSLAPEPSVEKK